MKLIYRIFLAFNFIIPGIIFSQSPEFNVKAMNFLFVSPNIIEFDIRIEHTNSPTPFEYSSGQYFLNFNPLIANGGNLSFNYSTDSSDLPVNMRPRNPQISGSQLRLAANIFPGNGNGFIMTNNGSPGTKIARMKLQTTASSFAEVPLLFEWRNQSPDPFTKIYAYINNLNINVSPNALFSIDTSGILSTVNIKVAVEGLYRTILNKHLKRDSIKLYLRNINSPYNLVDSAISILDSNSLLSNFAFRYLPDSNYYLVMKYINSLETWSRAGGEIINLGSTIYYDFTNSSSKAYGNNLVLKGSTYCLYSGDIDKSGFIDISDMSKVYNDGTNFLSGDVITDLNGDRFVDIDDLAIADNNVFIFAGVISP